MKRRQALASFAAAGTTAIAGTSITSAQDDVDVVALEDRVRTLERQMARVLDRLDALEGASPDDDSADQGEEQEAAESFAIAGNGGEVTDSFPVEEGNYEVMARVPAEGYPDNFAVIIYDDGGSDLLFNEIPEGAWQGEAVYRCRTSGSAYLEVKAPGPWELTFTKR